MKYICNFTYFFKANTDILAGVKAELGTPSPDKPNKGRLEFFVDW